MSSSAVSVRSDVTVRVTPAGLSSYLGPPRYIESPLERRFRVGVANGLAWTETGGELMTIEVTTVPGKGTLNLTGKLGERIAPPFVPVRNDRPL